MKFRGEAIEVRRRPGAGVPESFLWRDRLYLVRAVLGHWKEPWPWWTDRPAQVLRGEDVDIAAPGLAPEPGRAGRPGRGSFPAPEDSEVWRVEAGAGRMTASGIYDVLRVPDLPGTAEAWRLLRVAD
jgi:hypothetical protein